MSLTRDELLMYRHVAQLEAKIEEAVGVMHNVLDESHGFGPFVRALHDLVALDQLRSAAFGIDTIPPIGESLERWKVLTAERVRTRKLYLMEINT